MIKTATRDRVAHHVRRPSSCDSVLVVVLAVNGVAVTVVRVVGVITVWDRDMTTPFAVDVGVIVVGTVVSGLALVEVAVVGAVEVAVMGVVHVVLVRNGHVPAVLPVDVTVVGVLEMRRGHGRLPFAAPETPSPERSGVDT